LPNYQHLTLDELLNLAQDRDELTDEARLQLEAELAARKVTGQEIESYARETAAQERVKQRRTERSSFLYETRNKQFLGKNNRYHDPRERIEEFDTTLWFTVWIPIIPLGSYRIRRRFRKWWNPCPIGKLHILGTRPLDWKQIFLTWGKTALIVLILELALRR